LETRLRRSYACAVAKGRSSRDSDAAARGDGAAEQLRLKTKAVDESPLNENEPTATAEFATIFQFKILLLGRQASDPGGELSKNYSLDFLHERPTEIRFEDQFPRGARASCPQKSAAETAALPGNSSRAWRVFPPAWSRLGMEKRLKSLASAGMAGYSHR
jgi:hypothetical protein